MKKIASAVVIGFGLTLSANVFAAKPVKVPVCHFDEEENLWVLIKLPAKAAQNHLNRHDDASPGGVTAITGTQLDENCEVAAAPAFDDESGF